MSDTVDAPASVRLSERACAKVNLTLHVLGRREDGYHDLDSLVAFAGCADDLAFTSAPELSLVIAGAGADACGAPDDNLVIRAARRLSDAAPGLGLGAFELRKALPVAAGIGGGSADAAAALRLLARAHGLAADDARLIAAARATGSDVPVCLLSRGCVMSGAGERVAPLDLPRLPCVLVNPGVPVATKDVFAAIGLRPGQSADAAPPPRWPGSGRPAAEWIAAIAAGRNDLEPPALRLQPVIADVLEALRATPGSRLARMSGSGATCFALYDDDASAAAAARALRAQHARWWIEASALR